MAQIAGKYQHEKDENLIQYMKEVDIPEEVVEKVTQPGFTIEISEEGNKYRFKATFGETSETFLMPFNEEFEEPLAKGIKSIAKRAGDNIIVNSKFPNGRSGTKVYEFTNEGFTASMTMGDIAAKRCFKRV